MKQKPLYSIEPSGSRWRLLDEQGAEVGSYASADEALEQAKRRNDVAELLRASGAVGRTSISETAAHLASSGALKLGEIAKSRRGRKKSTATGQLPGIPTMPSTKPAPAIVATGGGVLEDPSPQLTAKQLSKMLAGLGHTGIGVGERAATTAATPAPVGPLREKRERGRPAEGPVTRAATTAASPGPTGIPPKPPQKERRRPTDTPAVFRPLARPNIDKPQESKPTGIRGRIKAVIASTAPPSTEQRVERRNPPEGPATKAARTAATPNYPASRSTIDQAIHSIPTAPNAAPALTSPQLEPATRGKWRERWTRPVAPRAPTPPRLETAAGSSLRWSLPTNFAKQQALRQPAEPTTRPKPERPQRGIPASERAKRRQVQEAAHERAQRGGTANMGTLAAALRGLVALLRGDLHGVLHAVASMGRGHGGGDQGAGGGFRGGGGRPGVPRIPSIPGGGGRRGRGPIGGGGAGGGGHGGGRGGRGGRRGGGMPFPMPSGRGGRLASATVAGSVAGMVGGTGAGIGATIGGLIDPAGGEIVGAALGMVAEQSTRAAVAIGSLPIKIERWGDSLIESQRDIMRFNGQISNTFAMLKRQEFQLGARTARATGETTKQLGAHLMELKEELQPLREIAMNVKNLTATLTTNLATQLVKNLAPIVGQILGALGPLAIVAPFLQAKLQEIINEQKKANRMATNDFQDAFRQAMNRPVNDKL